ncbi:MAG: hypothetical protein V1716_01355 [Candidatus Uhrbacteria bacterium]
MNRSSFLAVIVVLAALFTPKATIAQTRDYSRGDISFGIPAGFRTDIYVENAFVDMSSARQGDWKGRQWDLIIVGDRVYMHWGRRHVTGTIESSSWRRVVEWDDGQGRRLRTASVRAALGRSEF